MERIAALSLKRAHSQISKFPCPTASMKLLTLALLVVGTTSFSVPLSHVRSPVSSLNSRTLLSVSAATEEKESDLQTEEKETDLQTQDKTDPVQESLPLIVDESATALPRWFAPAAWRGVVGILCALWASNFAAAKLILAEPGVDTSLYAVTRFAVAALALAPFALNAARKRGMDWETALAASACGAWVAFGYLGQTLGLLTTTASRSCVICSLHCVFVALIAESMRVSRSSQTTTFDYKRLIPAALAVVGVVIVELQGAAGAPTIGDALSFAQPVGFGMGYLQLEEIMSKRPDAALPVSAIKLVVVALASLGLFELTPLFSDVSTDFMFRLPEFGAILSSPVAVGGILYTGVVTTALALWVESIAFAKVPATDASIILTTEPIFAALFGAITLGETFGISDYAGASLIVAACVLATLMDNPGDPNCVVGEDEVCEPPREWPFWGF